MKAYEGMWVVDPELKEEDQEKIRESVEELIKRHEGTVDHVEKWGKRKLAYRLKKRHEGVYYVLRFKAPEDVVAKLEKANRLNESIIRSLIVTLDGAADAPKPVVEPTPAVERSFHGES